MRLEFENTFGERRVLGHYNTEQEANKAISDFLKEHNFKSYYWNCSIDSEVLRIDVGSHTEFFYLYLEEE